jgi:hypothetical protein
LEKPRKDGEKKPHQKLLTSRRQGLWKPKTGLNRPVPWGAARCCEENTVNSLIAQSGAKKTGGMSRFHAMVLEDLDTLW